MKKGSIFLFVLLFLSFAPTAIHAQELKNPVASLKIATQGLSHHFPPQQEKRSTWNNTAVEQSVDAGNKDIKNHPNSPVSKLLSVTNQIVQKLNSPFVKKHDTEAKTPEGTVSSYSDDGQVSKGQRNKEQGPANYQESQAMKESNKDSNINRESLKDGVVKPSIPVNPLQKSSASSIKSSTDSTPGLNVGSQQNLLTVNVAIGNATLGINVVSPQNLLAVNAAIGNAALGLNAGSQQNLLAVNTGIGEATIGLNVGSQQNLLAVNTAIGEATLGLNVVSPQNLLAVNAAIGNATLGLNVVSPQNLLAVNAAIGEATLGLSLLDANKGLIGLQIPIIEINPVRVGLPTGNGNSENSNDSVSSGEYGSNSDQVVEVTLPAVSGLENANNINSSKLFNPDSLSDTDDPLTDGSVLPILANDTNNTILTPKKGLEAKFMDLFMDRESSLAFNSVHNQTGLDQNTRQQGNHHVNGTLENELGYLSSTASDSSNGNSGSSSSGGAGVYAIIGSDCHNNMGLRSQLQFFLKELADKWIKVPPTTPPKTTFFLYV